MILAILLLSFVAVAVVLLIVKGGFPNEIDLEIRGALNYDRDQAKLGQIIAGDSK